MIAIFPKFVFLDLVQLFSGIIKPVQHPVPPTFGFGAYGLYDGFGSMFFEVPNDVGQSIAFLSLGNQMYVIAHQYSCKNFQPFTLLTVIQTLYNL